MSTNNNHNEERTSDLAVMGANEYKQKRRLERILDAHDRVEDTADDAWQAYVAGDIGSEAKDISIQKAVKKAIREAYNLLIEHASEAQGDDQYWIGDPGNPIGIIDQGHEPTPIIGLRDFLHTEELYEERWMEDAPQRHGPDEVVEQSTAYTVPEDLSWKAYLRLKQFLSTEHDLEIRFEELDDSLPNWGYEEVEDDAED